MWILPKIFFIGLNSPILSAESHRVLWWLPSHQRWRPKLAGVPHRTTFPSLAYRSLDSLESYLSIQHRRHRVYGLPESLTWRFWHHQRRTHGGRNLSAIRLRQVCVNCTARTWYFKGVWPLHIDSDLTGSCNFDGSDTDAAIAWEDNFGLYAIINTKFRCTSSSDATTQFWIGGTEWSHDHCFNYNLNWLELLLFLPENKVQTLFNIPQEILSL